jgi:hypothetical protein
VLSSRTTRVRRGDKGWHWQENRDDTTSPASKQARRQASSDAPSFSWYCYRTAIATAIATAWLRIWADSHQTLGQLAEDLVGRSEEGFMMLCCLSRRVETRVMLLDFMRLIVMLSSRLPLRLTIAAGYSFPHLSIVFVCFVKQRHRAMLNVRAHV